MSDSQTPQYTPDEELTADELDNVAGGSAFAASTDPVINENCGGNCGCSAAV